jgi:hypothetical protein
MRSTRNRGLRELFVLDNSETLEAIQPSDLLRALISESCSGS